jgi:Mg/Co/Ni transporter MgtE
MQPLDVSSLLFNAKELIIASHLLAMLLLENASSNQFSVMMEINALLILVMQALEIASTLLLTVMTIMHVPLTLAILQVDPVYMSAKFVTIKTSALLIAATPALEIVSSPTFLLN